MTSPALFVVQRVGGDRPDLAVAGPAGPGDGISG
jgi:hypothetical protein